MTSSSPSSLQKKTIVRYFSGVVSGIILCILAFSLYNAHFPIWSVFLLMGIYSACITFLTIVFYQKKLAKTERNQEKQLSILRHDIKGILSSALLMADRILLNKSADEKTTQSAESIAQSIEKVADYLKKTKQ